ncbi:benzoate/H(+) symporter BenE family transporter [Mycobacterium lepromatosis]|uniref:benzoate/H(+) symporter BenE family transporter n=2 Tax=Mycobacterium lepromatosis TaxID=480418 RepID=UPI00249DAC80|nr:benzoate/H(+) symporter BenE family transporter [Mycobacterium lepromatosis]
MPDLAPRPGCTPVAGGADPVALAGVHQIRATIGGAVGFRGYVEHGRVHPPLGHVGTVASAPELDSSAAELGGGRRVTPHTSSTSSRLADQNVPGVVIMGSLTATRLPWREAMTVTGLGTFFGGHAINLAAVSAAAPAFPEVHRYPERRWPAATTFGFVYLVLAVLATLVAASTRQGDWHTGRAWAARHPGFVTGGSHVLPNGPNGGDFRRPSRSLWPHWQ